MAARDNKARAMLFGKSLFESVLTRLEEEAPEIPPEEPDTHRIRGFSTGFVANAMEGVSVSMARIGGAYLEMQPDELILEANSKEADEPQIEVGPPPVPAHLCRTNPDEIADDLNIGLDDCIADLQEKRRAFARDNHPDIVHPDHRAAASIRMTVANQLIDDALRRLGAMNRLGVKRPHAR